MIYLKGIVVRELPGFRCTLMQRKVWDGLSR